MHVTEFTGPAMIEAAVAIAIFATMAFVVAPLLLWSSLRRLRARVTRDLDRIFEAVDLVRLEQQQIAAALASGAGAPPRAAAARSPAARPAAREDYESALELAAAGVNPDEIVERCGLRASEARILVAMRGRRQ